ncbi:MAG: large conductance mechanosensitive channel protein MscL [Aquificae bacterium]|nr:large conductance mechanosensitive channel protein MscL [Aquificota bacterium]
MLNDFKKFIMRGNVIDMAVGIIIGAAFGKIVSSLVKDVIMPPIGLLLGNVDFSNLFIDLSGKGYQTLAEATKAGAPVIRYGVFINTVIEFLIIAFAVFMMIKVINTIHERAMKKEEEAPPAPTTKECSYCFMEIPINAVKCPHCTADLKE